jgi:hypothetical protein
VRRWRRALKRAVATTALALPLTAAMPVIGADAVPGTQGGLCGINQQIRWYFSNGLTTWTGGDQAATRDGFNAWSVAVNGDNTGILRFAEVDPASPAGNGAFAVRRRADDGAFVICNTTPRTIDLGRNAYNALRKVAVHEGAHAHGITHVGVQDDLYVGEPVMSGCSTLTYDSPISPTRDDYAAAQKALDGQRLTPNAGHENGFQFWETSGAFSIQTASPFRGAKYGRLSGNGSYIAQSIRRTIPNANVAYRIAYKTNGSGSSNFKFEARPVDYPAGSCPQNTPSNIVWDSPAPGTWAFLGSRSLPANSGWTVPTAPTNVPPPAGGFGAHNGYDLRLSVWNYSNAYLFVDEVELRDA